MEIAKCYFCGWNDIEVCWVINTSFHGVASGICGYGETEVEKFCKLHAGAFRCVPLWSYAMENYGPCNMKRK